MGSFTVVLACIVIITLDVVSGILSFSAEAAQNQKNVRLWILECEKPSHDAFVLAIAAAALLGLAHVIANLVGGCAQQKLTEPSSSSSPYCQIISIASLVLTWIVLGIGLSMLAMGIISNQKKGSSCDFVYSRFLHIGGLLCMVHALFAVVYYLTSASSI
ncbi:hypothetical protein M569_03819, partial [Genlisea aurea]